MSRMKILHIGNVAGVANTISDIHKKMGYESIVMSFNKHCHLFPGDYNYYILDNFPFNIFKNIQLIFKLFPNFDIYHFHARSIIPKNLDFLIWKQFGKKIFLHHHGSEIRGKQESYFGKKYSSDIFISTPDLFEWSPNAIWIPNPINIDQYPFIGIEDKDKTDPVVIVHAPTNRVIKGSDIIIDTIRKMKFNGYNIDFMLIENTSHKETIEVFKTADIIIDQIRLGWYGMVAVESMALGKPVCAYIREDLTSFIPNQSIHNCHITNLEQQLKILFDDIELRKQLSINGRQYVNLKHDSNNIGKLLIHYYEK